MKCKTTLGGAPDCAPMRNNHDVSARIGVLLLCTKLMFVHVRSWLTSLLQIYKSGRLLSMGRCSCLPFSWMTVMATQDEWSTGSRGAPDRFPPTCSIMTSALFRTDSACLCCAPPGYMFVRMQRTWSAPSRLSSTACSSLDVSSKHWSFPAPPRGSL